MLREDLRVYGARPFRRELSVYAIVVYRLGRWNDARSGSRLTKSALRYIYLVLSKISESVTNITLPKEAEIGRGLRIFHSGPVVVHPDAVIGRNCKIRQGVTIGERRHGEGVPRIGDDVEIGAYAQVLGPIKVGDGARIGALALVIRDMQPGSVALAPPATITDGTDR